jgi:ElaA protein
VHRSPGPELSAAELYALLRLRAQVFVVEQECPYLDPDGRDLDATTLHLWIERDAAVVATVRILADADGATRIGRVVTAVDVRGQGLAGQLLELAIAAAPGPHVMDAQSHLNGYYARFGFVRDGEDFVEDGILHTPLRRP